MGPSAQASVATGPRVASLAPVSQFRLPRALRRRVNHLRRVVVGRAAPLIYGEEYELDIPGVPMDPLRGERVLNVLVGEGHVAADAVWEPPRASLASLARVHGAEYLEGLGDTEFLSQVMGAPLEPTQAQAILEHQRRMTGGTMLAARLARAQRTMVVNLGGGLHHAHGSKGHGFCAINDVAVAVASLRDAAFHKRIMVVDLDLHDGDGTRALFAEDATVHTFSIHNDHWGETNAVASTSVALGADVGDQDYLATLRRHLPRALAEHRPRLVFFVAGADPAADDGLGNWRISAEAMFERDRFVVEQLRHRGVDSVVWLLAGGYGSEAWRYTTHSLAWALGGVREPVLPTTAEATLMRYRYIGQSLDEGELSGGLADLLSFDETDFLAGLEAQSREQRLLGYYSRHGVELALEKYGILPRLRKLGFDPHVELELGDPNGDTIRVWGKTGREELLAEIRMRRDRSTVVGMELLSIEWLLLQNPRAQWMGGRRPLPGQQHPGLGMFADVLALQQLMCERLDLDGIVVVPSHYHVAAQWRARLHFLDPVDEGRFRSAGHLLSSYPTAKAARIVQRGLVREKASGHAYVYEPKPMVFPVKSRLRERVVGKDYEARAVEAEQTLAMEFTVPDPASCVR